ncbi:MAG TPA: hypothetical protein VNS22_12460 [Geminicoccus sp.]|uniref:hypothetical protein n=1 Tax=Geminicoccus sp. TaxID=2024832 RepID=UPI002CF1BC08|nr:hypothetical protein [Geminicoccus sp.]HWL69184.1 hypothetical protein [Geminicoccus sp.]
MPLPASGAFLRSFAFDDGIVVQDGTSGQIWLLEGEPARAWPRDGEPAAPGQASPAPVPAPAPAGPPALELTVAQGSMAARVRCWEPVLARTFAGALAPLVSDGGAAACTIDLYPSADGPVVAVDGMLAHRPGSLGLGRWLALRRLAVELAPGRHWLALLHAATVAMPFGAVILAATSGSGKTTLAGALLAAGGALLSDDITPIEAGSRQAWPFPLAMSVKEGSWPLFARMHADFALTVPVSIGTTRVRYFAPARRSAPRGQPVAMVIVPRYRAGARLDRQRLRPIELLRSLVESGTWPPAAGRDLTDLLAWLERVPAFRLTYGDLDEAVAAIGAIGRQA